MTEAEHQQIAEVNAQWRNMNTPKDIEAAREAAWADDFRCDSKDDFCAGFDAAVAYLSEPGAMRFLANEMITKENDALRKRIAELEGKR